MTVLIAKDWDEHFVAETLFLRVPIDVEEAGVSAGGAVLKDIPPEAILAADRHVVGDDVEDLAEAVFAELLREAFVGFAAA